MRCPPALRSAKGCSRAQAAADPVARTLFFIQARGQGLPAAAELGQAGSDAGGRKKKSSTRRY